MGPISRSKACLRVTGHGFTEDEINSILETSSTEFKVRNIPVTMGGSGVSSHWSLDAPVEMDLEKQIAWIFNQTTKDLKKWKNLTESFKVDLFCGAFMEHANEGIQFSSEIMRKAGERNVDIGIDIHSPEHSG